MKTVLFFACLLTACADSIIANPANPPTNTGCTHLVTGFIDLTDRQIFIFNASTLKQHYWNDWTNGHIQVEVLIHENLLVFHSAVFNFCDAPIHFWTHDLYYPIDHHCQATHIEATTARIGSSWTLTVQLNDNFLTDCPQERGGFYFALPHQ